MLHLKLNEKSKHKPKYSGTLFFKFALQLCDGPQN